MQKLPNNIPEPRGKSVNITIFVDASHAQYKRKRRSYTGYVIFVNRSPIVLYSKRQSRVESNTLSSEFISMKKCTETIIALIFKLQMFVLDIDGTVVILMITKVQ